MGANWHNTLNLHASQELMPWLIYPGSFTERLSKHAGQPVEINIISQSQEIPTPAEQEYLGMANKSVALIREVYLCADQKTWQYARTVIPLSSLNGKFRTLKNWHKVPLGKFLFSNPKIIRQPFSFSQLEKNNFYYQRAVKNLSKAPDKLWARRSIFSLSNQPLLITEVFLPGEWNHAR